MRFLDKKILYVEDEYIIRQSVVNMLLEEFPAENVFQAQNGIDGLEIFDKEDIDIILTDIRMPKMDGIQMINSIRKIDNKIPIIIISAFEKEFFKLSDMNISEFLLKPVFGLELIMILEKHFD